MNKPNTDKMELLNPQNIEESAELLSAIERDFGAATEGLHDGIETSEDGLSRRRWMQLMGASLALGGTVGCRYEEEQIAPFAFRPANRVPGIPQKFASVIEFDGVAEPVLATCYDGRPIKLDGNPDHPMSGGGGSSAFTQARILELYDPDRLRGPIVNGAEAGRDAVIDYGNFLSGDSLSGVAVLAESNSSPSLARLRKAFEDKGGKWFTFSPISRDNTLAGSKMAFGKPHRSHLKLDKAKVIVSLDADPLGMDQGHLANTRSFTNGRNADHGHMNRLYAIESQYTITGASADHRMSLQSGKIGAFAAALVDAVSKATPGAPVDKSLPYREKLFAAMVQDLVDHKGESLVVVGERQPAEIHALIHTLNSQLGNLGETILLTEETEQPSSIDSIKAFADAAKDMKAVVIIGGNPVYSAPRELKMGETINGIANSIHLTVNKNETSSVCKVVSDVAHDLEAWTDGIAYDGSVCVGQPLISPLFGAPSVLEALSAMMGEEKSGLDIVKETVGAEGFDKAVHDGFVTSEPNVASPSLQEVAMPESTDWNSEWDGTLEIVFAPSNSIYDGRFANNAWLQELPDFFTKITWDNAALVSPKTAAKLKLKEQKLVTIKVNGSEIRMPVHIQPGQADGSVGVAIGYGRTEAGRVGGNLQAGINRYAWAADKVGADVGDLRSADAWLMNNEVTLTPSSSGYKLAITQEPWEIDKTGRDEIQARMFRNYNKTESDRSALIREGTFESYKEFMAHQDDHDHDHASAKPSKPKMNNAVSDGSLPVINNVGFIEPFTDGEKEDDHAHEEGDDHGHDDHGHGDHHWPEAFHLHHENFDITPGSRETYRADKTQTDKYGNTIKNRWGMSIDLNKCTGCSSCVIACQAENNIPIVGKSQVWRGREMHWLRIDRYYGDNLYNEEAAENDDKQIVHQPVTCHHCENAPCETVCPVAATVHSSEGLNDMVYNRCIGTRYCGNNCPYKVRRFNYFNYSDAVTLVKYPGADKLPKGDLAMQGLMMNPEVTVRSRGVMEKCTYCTQRISNTKIKAKVEKREIGPNEIKVACQEACAADAIQFGDLVNKESNVAKAHANKRSYVMLEELNNHPRTRYLARVRNPHPALVDWDDRNSVRGGRANHDDVAHDDHDHSEAEAAH